MANATDTGILIHEATSKNILWANPAACRMFGFTLEELKPLKAHHMSSPEAAFRRSVGVAWLQDAYVNGRSVRRWKYRTASGEDFLTYAVAVRVLFADGPVVMVQFRPIDDEERLHEQLTRTTDYLHRLMSHAAAGVVLLDDENRVVDTSPAAAGLLGASASEIAGQLLTDLAVVRPVEALGRDELHGPAVEMRLEVSTPTGTQWLIGMLERVSHDGISSRLLVVRDISQRVELERAAEYREASMQYLSRYNAMGDMAMIIAHELGQPLAAAANFLSGITSRLESGAVSADDVRYGIERAARQLQRSSEIVASVKRYVRRFEHLPTATDVNAIIVDSLYFARLRAQEHGVEIVADLSAETLPIVGEEILLGQVVLNLCFNAIDEVAGLEPGRRTLRLRSWRERSDAVVTVTDSGRGMPAVEGDRLTTAFSSKQDGTGIGLAISERIIERHRGRLTFTGNDPIGTVARIELPLAE